VLTSQPGQRLTGWRGLWLFWLLLILVAPRVAQGAEFSAQMILKDGPKIMPGRIYVKDGKMRQEFSDEDGQTITIIRPDKKVMWVVIPQERTYVELPFRGKLPGQFPQIPLDAVTKRKVGTEMINGYLADRYEVTTRGGARGVTRQTVWVAQKLDTPVKMVSPDARLSLEYKNIREGEVADRFFEPPPGYKKTTQPAGVFMDR
jgi:outer membrane lipoprotein-sorting protein